MEQYDVADVQRARDVPLSSVLGLSEGVRNAVRCPFHQDRTPSFMVYPDGHYFCFGCGQKGKNSIDFLIALGNSFTDSVEELLKYTK